MPRPPPGVRTLAITDHDTLAGYRELVRDRPRPRRDRPDPGRRDQRPGARASRSPDGELHILGFGMDPDDAAFEAALATQRAARRVRFERTVALLREIGMPIDEQLAHLDLGRDDALGRPTIGRALIAAGHASERRGRVPAPDRRRRSGLRGRARGWVRARRSTAIRAAGGVPVLAHFSEAPEQVPLLRELAGLGLAGLEVYHLSFGPETVAAVSRVAKRSACSRPAARTTTATPRRMPRPTPRSTSGAGWRRGAQRDRGATRLRLAPAAPSPLPRRCPRRRGPVGRRRPRRTMTRTVYDPRPAARSLPVLDDGPAGHARSRPRRPPEADDRASRSTGPRRRRCRVPRLDARLPDEPERLGGDGRARCSPPAAPRRRRWTARTSSSSTPAPSARRPSRRSSGARATSSA